MKKLIAALLLLTLVGCGMKPETPTMTETPAATETPVETEAPLVTEAPLETEPPSPVYTDWSKLTPYEPGKPIFTLHPGYVGADALEARDDYGVLLPYIGAYASKERYMISALPLYGLVTDKGEIVTDPVYSDINFYEDCLVLYRGDPQGVGGGDTYFHGPFSRTLAAPDGHWVHELPEGYFVGNSQGKIVTAGTDGSLEIWNSEGEVTARFDGETFNELFGEGFYWGEEGGPFLDWTDDKVGYATCYRAAGEHREEPLRAYLDLAAGTVSDTPPEGYPEEIDYDALSRARSETRPVPPTVDGCRSLSPITDRVTGEVYYSGYNRHLDSHALYDGAGNRLLENADLTWPFEAAHFLGAGLYAVLEDGCFCFLSLADGTTVFRYPMRTNSD